MELENERVGTGITESLVAEQRPLAALDVDLGKVGLGEQGYDVLDTGRDGVRARRVRDQEAAAESGIELRDAAVRTICSLREPIARGLQGPFGRSAAHHGVAGIRFVADCPWVGQGVQDEGAEEPRVGAEVGGENLRLALEPLADSCRQLVGLRAEDLRERL